MLAMGSVLLVAALAWAALLWQILPRVDQWRPELAEQATRALGVRVQIGQILGHAQGIWPVLSLRDVRLLDAQGRTALRLPEVSARVSLRTLSPMALWQRELVLAQITLVSPELDVRRDRDGTLHVAGLQIGASTPGKQDTTLADWAFTQSRIDIQQGTVRWTDEAMGAPTLALQQLDLSVRNGWGLGRRSHGLRIAATPPAAFGGRFSLKGDFKQPLWTAGGHVVREGESVVWWERLGLRTTRAADWSGWSGTLEASLPHVDVQRLRQHVRLPLDVEAGHGALQASLRIAKGEAVGVRLQAAVRDLRMRLAPGLLPLAFKRLDGVVSLDHAPRETTLHYEGLAYELDEGLVWPASSGRLLWRHAPWRGPLQDAAWPLSLGGEAQADRLDLALLARLADRLPLTPTLRAHLASLAPEGVVAPLSWRWEGPVDAPRRYQAEGRIKGLGWAPSAQDGRPGLAQADVQVKADERSGRAQLTVTDGWLAFPGVFEEPRVPMSRLQAQVDWAVQPGASAGAPSRFSVNVSQASFANEDAAGELEARWHTGEGQARFPGWLDLKGQLGSARADRVWRYLPEVIPKDARDYVRHALREGRGDKATFEAKGPLEAFPFKDDQGGRFRVNVPVRQLKLDYVPAELEAGSWPVFTSLDGELAFEGQRMLIKGGHGRLGGVGTGGFNLHHVEGRIDDLGAHDPRLRIKGQGEGLLSDMLGFLSASPVGGWTGGALSQAQARGKAAMQLALDIPLNHAEATTLQGQVNLTEHDGASLRLLPSLPEFTELRGHIGFTESRLSVQARSRVWGQVFAIDGHRDSEQGTRFTAHGTVSAEGLRQAVEIPVLPYLGQHAVGEAPVTVQVLIPREADEPGHGHPEVQITSSLQGLAVQLPAPLNKPAQAIWSLKVGHRADDAQATTDAIQVEVGAPQPVAGGSPWLKLDLRRDLSGAQARLSRGSLSLVQAGIGAPAGALPLPAKGLTVSAQVDALDTDAWRAVAQGHGLGRATGAGASLGSELAAFVPDVIQLKAASLTGQSRTLREVDAMLTHSQAGAWRAQIQSPQMAGVLEWLPDGSPQAGPRASKLVARLSRLLVPAAEAQAMAEQATAQMLGHAPTSDTVPALDVVIDQFEWRGRALGRLEIDAVSRSQTHPGGLVLPEWRLNRFRIQNPDAQFMATGDWSATPGSRKPRASFNFTLDLTNSGQLLTRMGLPQTLKGGKGQLAGEVSWAGTLLEPDPVSMSGDIHVLINEGQFLKVEPGMAKLLGVLSLQALPRRLVLDFRDVFQEGFAFDRIDGDVRIRQGLAQTRNLRMRGVQAVVLMEGQADLARETQNLQVFVVPEVNAASASLAYAAINPVVGLSTFIAQVLLRKQVAEVGSRTFRVTGPWADPLVERIPFNPEAASAAEAAASAASTLTKPRKPS
ncbi:YhdP family protein [Aquabacterium sp.]|uniref:YhdP family protein n=1 Tax=Aquabacterium sp. TaxID=1872578 RepID=UPI0025C6FF4B|nr:YhdP family protein [Aquabacterium sp.]